MLVAVPLPFLEMLILRVVAPPPPPPDACAVNLAPTSVWRFTETRHVEAVPAPSQRNSAVTAETLT